MKEGVTMSHADVKNLIQSLLNMGIDIKTINAIVTAIASGTVYKPE